MILENLIPYTKINSKRIKDLNIRPKIVKLLEKNIGHSLTKIIAFFFNLVPKAKEIKAKINKWDIIALNSVHTAKESTGGKKKKDSLLNERKYSQVIWPRRG